MVPMATKPPPVQADTGTEEGPSAFDARPATTMMPDPDPDPEAQAQAQAQVRTSGSERRKGEGERRRHSRAHGAWHEQCGRAAVCKYERC